MKEDAKNVSLPTFYAGRSVFITGATGFLGKALIEKLLRSCSNISEIFLLIRSKKGLSIDDRTKKLLNNKLFDKLRREQPHCFEKLIPVSGDVSIEGLGLLPDVEQMLIERVSVIFHIAAIVKFDESLKNAIFNNTRSTRDICILATKMKKLAVLLHVSSTYTQTDKCTVDETLYPYELDWKQAIKIAETVDEHTLRIFTAKYIKTMPNTYTFTKRLAEQVISDYSGLPICVFRPSVVISSMDEPFPGWIDNFNGPIGMLVGGGKGILRVLHVNCKIASDFMPVDMAIKAMIITAWKRGIKTIVEDSTIHVYNCSSNDMKRVSYQQLVQTGFEIIQDVPLDNILWTPNTILTCSRLVFYVLMLLLHIFPAILIDGALKIIGARPALLKLQRKVFVANSALSYYLFNEWNFKNKKLLELFDEMNNDHETAKDFTFSYHNVNFPKYFTNGIIGAKLYLLNEDMNKLDAAKIRYKRMEWLNTAVTLLFVIIMIMILYRNNMLSYFTEILSYSREDKAI